MKTCEAEYEIAGFPSNEFLCVRRIGSVNAWILKVYTSSVKMCNNSWD